MKKWNDTRPRARRHTVCHLSKNVQQDIWSVVLAGEQETSEWGTPNWSPLSPCPWPYRLNGEEACIQGAWKQAKFVSSPHRVLTVMNQAHWGYAWKILIQESLGRMVWQPESRGNVLGVFLPVSYIRFHDPEGIVIVWFVRQAGGWKDTDLTHVHMAVKRVQQLPRHLVALAVTTASDDSAEPWELPGAVNDAREGKPRNFTRVGLGNRHNLQNPIWNDIDQKSKVGVLVAQVETLWTVGRQFFPTLLNRLDALGPVLGTSRERQILRDLYRTMPVQTLSAHLFPFLDSQLDILPLSLNSCQRERPTYPVKET
jgi:hypothetical protein